MLAGPQTAEIVTAADRRAEENFATNISMIARSQPDLARTLGEVDAAPTWMFARDGYLSARTDSQWWTGCSVPMQTARQLLKKLELAGTLGCFLSPTHAGQLRACFEKIQWTQAVLAVVPANESLKILLHCDDFSAEISAGRLFFAAGDNWAEMFRALFEKLSGLPLPQQFVRTALLDDAEMSRLSNEAQAVISRETARRSEIMPEILSRGESRSTSGRVLVLAGSRLNLADLSNVALRRALLEEASDASFTALDPDRPVTASPLALAEAAADADALISADLFRADLPGVVSRRTAWITWVTNGRIVAPDPQFPHDALILADAKFRKPALDAGWPDERIQLAGWPRILPTSAPSNTAPFLGLLSDTQTIEIPQRVKDFSSQLLLWEMIEDELARDPLALGSDPDKYLDSRMDRFKIGQEGFDRAMFFEQLIAPAYKAGLSRFLLKHGLPLRLIGRGWDQTPDLKPHSFGAVNGIDDLTKALAGCRAIIQAFPGGTATIGALSLPEIELAGMSSEGLLRRIREALRQKDHVSGKELAVLSPDQILAVIAARREFNPTPPAVA